eukprot:TRINITY_DN4165_c1_g1_i3.p1 TRINITY_DN4165_c1_g1~~TRINITY_DN4165_c1_g1_i3.p1  ORF type:complete len:513 (-),score=162.59 TRINITY_DN4165_c1_g1_i3:50-1588(-)
MSEIVQENTSDFLLRIGIYHNNPAGKKLAKTYPTYADLKKAQPTTEELVSGFGFSAFEANSIRKKIAVKPKGEENKDEPKGTPKVENKEVEKKVLEKKDLLKEPQKVEENKEVKEVKKEVVKDTLKVEKEVKKEEKMNEVKKDPKVEEKKEVKEEKKEVQAPPQVIQNKEHAKVPHKVTQIKEHPPKETPKFINQKEKELDNKPVMKEELLQIPKEEVLDKKTGNIEIFKVHPQKDQPISLQSPSPSPSGPRPPRTAAPLPAPPNRGQAVPITHGSEDSVEPSKATKGTPIQIKLLRVPEHTLLDQPDKWLIALALPGASKDHIQIDLSKGTLTISAPCPSTESEKRLCVYQKKIELPKAIDLHKLQYQATFENGILLLEVNKPFNPNKGIKVASPLKEGKSQQDGCGKAKESKWRGVVSPEMEGFVPRDGHRVPAFMSAQVEPRSFGRVHDAYLHGLPRSNLVNNLFRTFWNDDFFNDDDLFNYCPQKGRPRPAHSLLFPSPLFPVSSWYL